VANNSKIKKTNNILKFFKKMVLFVARLDKMDNLKDSQPCGHCYKVIKKLGIKKIVYSTDQNNYDYCKTVDYEPSSISLGYSYIRDGYKKITKKN
tara:strand:- start:727 stop:1011 length:285 start_codon:yes stop_codon:yes gene_type:complete